METEKNRKIAISFFESANIGDMESSLGLLSDDIVWRGIGTSRFSGEYNGKDTVLAELVGPLFSNLKAGIHTTVERTVAEGDHVVIQASGSAETVDGVEYNNRYCFILKIADERICEVVEYCDTALIDKVFGA